MTQYNTLHIKLSHLQLNKLKSGIKNNIDVTLKISKILKFQKDILWYNTIWESQYWYQKRIWWQACL